MPYSSVALIRAARPGRGRAGAGTCRSRCCSPRSRCSGWPAARPQVRADVPVSSSSVILARRRVRLDVRHRRRPEPAERRAGRGPRLRPARRRRHPDRAGRVRRVRAARGRADDRPRRADERDRLADHRPRHRDRRRDPQVGGRDRRRSTRTCRRPDLGLGPAPGAADAAPATAAAGAGRHAPEIVVLLTDGANTLGVDAGGRGEVAAERGVRVYPIGFGTTNPTMMVCTAEQLGGNHVREPRPPRLGGGGLRGGGSPLVADEPTLRQVATITGGDVLRRRRRRPAPGGARRPAAARPGAAARHRDERVAGRPRRSPRAARGGCRRPVERVPVLIHHGRG